MLIYLCSTYLYTYTDTYMYIHKYEYAVYGTTQQHSTFAGGYLFQNSRISNLNNSRSEKSGILGESPQVWNSGIFDSCQCGSLEMHTFWNRWSSGLQQQSISCCESIRAASSGTSDYSSIRVFCVANPRTPDPELQLFSVEDEAPYAEHEGVGLGGGTIYIYMYIYIYIYPYIYIYTYIYRERDMYVCV